MPGRPFRTLTAANNDAHIRALALALLAVLAALLGDCGPAAAAKKPNCAEQVVADWYDNGRVDYLYPLHCYREAIKSLPPDVKDYSSAKEEIERALQDAANRPPGERADTARRRGTDPAESGELTDRTTHTDETIAGGGLAAAEAPTPPARPSVPIPLIVLGGLSVLLLAAGLGRLPCAPLRRRRRRRAASRPPPAVARPPAAGRGEHRRR